MPPGVLVALLALALFALVTSPGDGRTETAIAVPLVAAVAVSTPLALVAVFGGVLVGYVALVVLEARTLLFGRRLRAAAALAGAAVPLATVAIGAAFGRVPSHPEVWLAGAVVPGLLAYDLRRQSLDRRTILAVAASVTLLSLVVLGVFVQLVVLGVPGDLWSVGSTAPALGLPLPAIAAIVLGGLLAGVLVRWRYGLHVAPLSVPLLAVWSLEAAIVPLTYVAALLCTWAALPGLRRHASGRRVAAVGGLAGALVAVSLSVIVSSTVAAAGGIAVLLAGVLAAEDARLLRTHAGQDRRHALALGASGYAILVLAGGIVATAGTELTRASTAAALTALAVIATVLLRRERARPSEQRLRTEERRWTP